jgi:anti-sigma regulatory factor (Ser/Thr protein kinase)
MQELVLTAGVQGMDGLPDLENECARVLCTWKVQSPAFLFSLHEILINALEITQNLSSSSTLLCVRLRLTEDTLEAEIPDDGPGMPPNWRECYLKKEMVDLLSMERGRGLLFIHELGLSLDSARDSAGKHIVILKARIQNDE